MLAVYTWSRQTGLAVHRVEDSHRAIPTGSFRKEVGASMIPLFITHLVECKKVWEAALLQVWSRGAPWSSGVHACIELSSAPSSDDADEEHYYARNGSISLIMISD